MSPTANEALRRPIGDPISGHVFQSDELDHVREDLDVDAADRSPGRSSFVAW
jgi:hypothetical protein